MASYVGELVWPPLKLTVGSDQFHMCDGEHLKSPKMERVISSVLWICLYDQFIMHKYLGFFFLILL